MCYIIYAVQHRAETMLITDDMVEADNYYQELQGIELETEKKEIPMSAKEVKEQLELMED